MRRAGRAMIVASSSKLCRSSRWAILSSKQSICAYDDDFICAYLIRMLVMRSRRPYYQRATIANASTPPTASPLLDDTPRYAAGGAPYFRRATALHRAAIRDCHDAHQRQYGRSSLHIADEHAHADLLFATSIVHEARRLGRHFYHFAALPAGARCRHRGPFEATFSAATAAMVSRTPTSRLLLKRMRTWRHDVA